MTTKTGLSVLDSGINRTPVGNTIPSTGAFTTLSSASSETGSSVVNGNEEVTGEITTPTGNITTLNTNEANIATAVVADNLTAGTFQLNEAAPLNHVLVGDGTHYVDKATTPTTTNANGSYRISADGTIEAWGTINVPPSGNTSNGAAITFPIAFTSPPNIQLNSTGLPDPGDSDTPIALQLLSKSTVGAQAYMAKVIIAGAGGSNFTETITIDWRAIGH